MRAYARQQVEGIAERLLEAGRPDRAVVTSKTFRSLARLDGAAAYAQGPRVPRRLRRSGLAKTVEKLQAMTVEQRAALPGVSESRAPQLLAGAVVAHPEQQRGVVRAGHSAASRQAR